MSQEHLVNTKMARMSCFGGIPYNTMLNHMPLSIFGHFLFTKIKSFLPMSGKSQLGFQKRTEGGAFPASSLLISVPTRKWEEGYYQLVSRT